MNIYDIEKCLNKKDGLWVSQSTMITNINNLKKSDSVRLFNKKTKKLSKRIQYVVEVYGKDRIIKVKCKTSTTGKYIYYDENIIFVGAEKVNYNRSTMMKEILKSMDNGILTIKKI